MTYVPQGAPFSERGGRLRGVIDLFAGRYPPFAFGFGVGSCLPVFHFHEISADRLEPALAYLSENGYRTASADEMAGVARGNRPSPKSVVLAFDDALASLWLVAAPLLRRYGFTAVAYAIPGRVAEAVAARPTLDAGPVDGLAADAADNPLCTWPELRALASSGVIDVQSHTWSHSMMFCGAEATEVVTPQSATEYFFNRPRLSVGDPPTFLSMQRFGYPLFPRRSRMSDARRFLPDEHTCARVEAFVADRGGAAFFEEPSWQAAIVPVLRAVTGQFETEADQAAAIEHELVASRDVLEAKLGTRVRHLCLPWGVTGTRAQSAIARLGFSTAVANRMSGRYVVQPGDDPYFLKRLPHRYIFSLPGRGRRLFRMLA